MSGTKIYFCGIMLQNYFVKQGLLAVVAAVVLLYFTGFENLQDLSKPIWYIFAFINVLFVVLYYIANESLKTKTHKDFVTVFGLLFAIKVGSALIWLLAAILLFRLDSNMYLLSFFGLYLSYTYLLAWHIFSQTKK